MSQVVLVHGIDGDARAVSDAMGMAGFDRPFVVGHFMAEVIIPRLGGSSQSRRALLR